MKTESAMEENVLRFYMENGTLGTSKVVETKEAFKKEIAFEDVESKEELSTIDSNSQKKLSSKNMESQKEITSKFTKSEKETSFKDEASQKDRKTQKEQSSKGGKPIRKFLNLFDQFKSKITPSKKQKLTKLEKEAEVCINQSEDGLKLDEARKQMEATEEHSINQSEDGLQLNESEKQLEATELQSTNESDENADILEQIPTSVTSLSSKQIKYLTFAESKQRLTRINRVLKILETSDEDTEYVLSELHKRGMMVWFMNNGVLRNMVFNNLKSFVELLKTIFDHNITDIKYAELEPKLLGIFKHKERSFNTARESLVEHGLMSSQMIELLLQQKRCDISVEAIIELLEKIDVGFRHKNNYVFIPFFVENKHIPQDIKLELESLTIVTPTNIGLQTKIEGNIPVIFFSYFVVKLYRKLDPGNPTQSVVLWKNGMRATAGDAVVLADYDGRSCIRLSVTGPPDELPYMWDFLSESVHKVEDLRCTWWPGNTQYYCY